jgi:chitin synthase
LVNEKYEKCKNQLSAGLLSRNSKESRRFAKVVVDMVAIAAQITGLIVWPLVDGDKKPGVWLIPAAAFLTSVGWWENYVSRHSPLGTIFLHAQKIV